MKALAVIVSICSLRVVFR